MDFMKHKLLFLPFLIAIVGLSMVGQRPSVDAEAAAPTANGSNPVVVELFTSQSCSSCPPADALLGEMAAKDPNIIAFSCHVTYWDHLNWKDTLSRKFCTNRQRAYAGFMQKNNVYTPQMVVNGEHEFVGSNRADAKRFTAESTTLPITLSTTANGGLSAQMPALPAGSPKQTLWLISYHASHTQDIASGENRGRTVTYTNSVATLDQVGVWDGTAQMLTFAKPDNDAKTPGYALIAQPRGFGVISAAGKL